MSIGTGQLIQITDVCNYFNSKVQQALDTAGYHEGNYPHFSGSASGYTNHIAIPNGQLAAKNIQSLTINPGEMNAAALWNNIRNIAITFNKVRKFNSVWQYRSGSSWYNVTSLGGMAVMNTGFPAVPGGSDSLDGTSARWTRSGGNIDLNPNSSLQTGQNISAAAVIQTIDDCYNQWYNNCFNGNVINYNLYTCHSNCHSSCHSSCHDSCHSSCHSSRGRR